MNDLTDADITAILRCIREHEPYLSEDERHVLNKLEADAERRVAQCEVRS